MELVFAEELGINPLANVTAVQLSVVLIFLTEENCYLSML
jgi:hypothetical protein